MTLAMIMGYYICLVRVAEFARYHRGHAIYLLCSFEYDSEAEKYLSHQRERRRGSWI